MYGWNGSKNRARNRETNSLREIQRLPPLRSKSEPGIRDVGARHVAGASIHAQRMPPVVQREADIHPHEARAPQDAVNQKVHARDGWMADVGVTTV